MMDANGIAEQLCIFIFYPGPVYRTGNNEITAKKKICKWKAVTMFQSSCTNKMVTCDLIAKIPENLILLGGM